MYLAKVAMDIVAKHMEPNENGVRIAWLDEMRYRKLLWSHRPITDFWRVGKGYAKKLEKNGMHTMGDVARMSIKNEDLLYKLFGINAELLIDHSWGWENVTIQSIKSYRPETNSISSGQVLQRPYNYNDAMVIVKSMSESLALDLTQKNLVTNQMVLTIEYDIENLTNPYISQNYKGEITIDRYGRKVPKHAHGTINLDHYTSSSKIIRECVMKLYRRVVDNNLLVRKIYVVANNIINEELANAKEKYEQINLLIDYEKREKDKLKETKEIQMQKSMLKMKEKYGKNAILKGTDLLEVSTTRDRNNQIGGHRA